MSDTIRFNGTRQEFLDLLRLCPSIFSGQEADPSGLVEGIKLSVGVEMLSIVKEAYVEKARGGMDAAGDSWAPLKPETVAYSRRHPGRPKYPEGHPKHRRPMLTDDQNTLWKRTFARTLSWLRKSIQVSRTEGAMKSGRHAALFAGVADRDMKAHAAAYAWIITKEAGGRTILDTYGSVPVEILRDTGQTLNSLSPLSGSPDQILRSERGAVVVGTNRKGANRHHRGDPNKGLPQRRLWPEVDRWPDQWWQRLLSVTRLGVIETIRLLALRGGALWRWN